MLLEGRPLLRIAAMEGLLCDINGFLEKRRLLGEGIAGFLCCGRGGMRVEKFKTNYCE